MTIEATQLLRDMIAIPSVNPMRAGSDLPVERELVDFVETTLRRAGIDCERQTVVKGRENVVAVIHASGNGATPNGLMLTLSKGHTTALTAANSHPQVLKQLFAARATLPRHILPMSSSR